MKAKSIKGKSTEEIQSALKEAMSDGFIPTLGIVFLSLKMDRRTICGILDSKNIQIFGATTEGEISESLIDKHSASILLLDIDPNYFNILFEEVEKGGYNIASRTLAKNSLVHFQNPAFIFSGSGVWDDPYIEKITNGFKEELGKDAKVFGGMAGADFSIADTYVFTNNEESSHGAIVIAFDSDKVVVNGVASCEWESIGTTKKITKSNENTVYAIDGESSLQLILRYAGITDPPDNLIDLYSELNQSLQIQLQRDVGDPIMRVAIIDQEKECLSFIGSMPEGAKIKFCLLPDLDILDETVETVNNLKNQEIPEADAVLYFACAGRLLSFGPEISREIEGVNKVWNAPMAGFFCQGEFGRATGGELEVHNLTSICVAIKEKQAN